MALNGLLWAQLLHALEDWIQIHFIKVGGKKNKNKKKSVSLKPVEALRCS